MVRYLPILVLAALAGCALRGGDDRPKPKPASFGATFSTKGAPLVARISTKSGQIEILEPDGSITTMMLEDAMPQIALSTTATPEPGTTIATPDLTKEARAFFSDGRPAVPRKTAQELALEAFAARTGPALPPMRPGVEVTAEDFLGAEVTSVKGDKNKQLIEVSAKLRKGVDPDIAFAYATCALAGWAKENGTGYARHIRSLQGKSRDSLAFESVYTLSETQPLGLHVMETKQTLRECEARGIPAA